MKNIIFSLIILTIITNASIKYECSRYINGKYEGFAGKLGTLEEKPKGKSKKGAVKRKGYQDADNVISTYQLFRSLHKNL
jgi:hypothetical protein